MQQFRLFFTVLIKRILYEIYFLNELTAAFKQKAELFYDLFNQQYTAVDNRPKGISFKTEKNTLCYWNLSLCLGTLPNLCFVFNFIFINFMYYLIVKLNC